ncbi:MAG TPA: adenylate/guanylate cyclase domain-containing protein [Candidatus Limenecus avicola]|uniref:Adenylate/guanylate cyclase domain-containing protein n=1 Tax=Candidatus Limenecus avicola TaxID=2840847 RepID=A0A9D1SRA4_9CLOT|nr:adenylate/guanylate cyclase domain-containing protein [Candidatus Limenecus avicola]
MSRKKLLLLFILSFLCVIYTLNNICYKHFDNKLDTIITQNRLKITDTQVINNILEQNKVIIISEHTRLVLTLGTSVLFLAVFVFYETIPAIVFIIIFLIAYLIAYKLLLNNFVYINIAGIIISAAVSKLYAGAYIHLFKENVDKKIENVLGKYISKDITNKILKNKAGAELGGKRSEITVMFADIRGFTSLSESHKAEEVSQLLNEYFTELEPIITKYNGVINKFIGDAVLVVFGDPTQDKLHAKNAVKCAYELRKKVKQIKQRWLEEGKPKIDIGIGINTGEAFIGNVGTKNRFEYTVIGDTVNIASRIEDYNKIYKTHILISENTYNKISQIVDVIKIREVSIKGKSKKINIYEVLRITE